MSSAGEWGLVVFNAGTLINIAMLLIRVRRLERAAHPGIEQAVATQAANAEVGEKAGEKSGPEGNSRA